MAFPENIHQHNSDLAKAKRERLQSQLQKIKSDVNISDVEFKTIRDEAYAAYHLMPDLQRKFVENYLRVGNASAAARMSGYSNKNANAQGAKLMLKPEVIRIIEIKRREAAEVYGLSREKLISELNIIKSSALDDNDKMIALKVIEMQAKLMGYFVETQINNNTMVDTSVNISLGGRKFNPDKKLDKNFEDETDFTEIDQEEEEDE